MYTTTQKKIIKYRKYNIKHTRRLIGYSLINLIHKIQLNCFFFFFLQNVIMFYCGAFETWKYIIALGQTQRDIHTLQSNN